MTVEDGTFTLKIGCSIKVKPLLSNITRLGPDALSRILKCKVVITMGRGVKAMEFNTFGTKDSADHRHEFSAILEDEEYRNQLKLELDNPSMLEPRAKKIIDSLYEEGGRKWRETDKLCQTHAIVRVYATTDELEPQMLRRRGNGPAHTSKKKKIARAWLLGTRAFRVGDLLTKITKNRETYSIDCFHNSSPEAPTATVTFTGTEKGVEQTTSVDEWYKAVEQRLVRQSDLRLLEEAHDISKVQQLLMRAYISTGWGSKTIKMVDEAAESFTGLGSILQVYGGSILFTDLTRVMLERGAELPLELVMVFVFQAFHNMCLDEETFHMTATDDECVDLVCSIVNGFVTDSEQGEYYSDYQVIGVRTCSKDEFDSKRQPASPGDWINPTKPEVWEYITGEGGYYAIRLVGTEDIRQLCTTASINGDQILGDDCENCSQAEHLIFACLQLIKVFCIENGLMNLIDALPRKGNEPSTGPSLKTLRNAGAVETFHERITLRHDPERNSVRKGPLSKVDDGSLKTLFVNLAVALNRFDFDIGAVVGSARAPSMTQVGGTTQADSKGEKPKGALCGHCYSAVVANRADLERPIIRQVEGTNWAVQHHDSLPGGCSYRTASEIAALLCECSKGAGGTYSIDQARARLDLGIDDPFYESVYVFKDSIVIGYEDGQNNGKGQFVFGQSAKEFFGNTAPMRSVKIRFELLSQHFAEIECKVDAKELHDEVLAIAREETVPAWSKEHWNIFMDGFKDCSADTIDLDAFDPNKHVRIAFTHQVATEPGQADEMYKIIRENVQKLLDDGDGQAVHGAYTGFLTDYLKQKNKVVPDDLSEMFKDAKEILSVIAGKVALERVVTALGVHTFVCRLNIADVPMVHQALKSWMAEVHRVQEVVKIMGTTAGT